LVNRCACDFYVFFYFDLIIQYTWFSFQGQLTTNLKHDIFLNGVVETSQGFLLHVANCIGVCNGEVKIGSRSGGVGSGDGVIQFEASYNELVDRDLG
jgi:hypothetical protein